MSRYAFDFTPSGYFTLLNKKGESYYEEAIPLVKKIYSHTLWIILWALLLLLNKFHALFTSLIMMHLFILGCHLSTLLIKGGIMPLLFPPLYIRITRELKKNPNLQLLSKYNLETHPGLLANLAIFYYCHEQYEYAEKTLLQALSYDEHPALIKLSSDLKIRP